jgi:quinol monooxygenase YgiN
MTPQGVPTEGDSMSTTTTDDAQPTVMGFATLVARPGRRDELRAALLRLVASTRREPGSIEYSLLEMRDAPGTFVMREAFASMDAFRAHQATEHYRAFGDGAHELLAQPLAVTFLTPVSD